ncbi:C40 family peptidase [Limosilactobacillus albertensis]|uniref:C40 family peptidase n=1 Tax=Limosilactobacillus albertensis TaxID=2759752 RepID=A0A839HCS4_9LACO|nr:C40 family peptidase [Limosilactobacillus albertensis]MBB1124022.1 C40 family peptidase [Limosilactobacillus albertensis]MCD7121767.1 NlpC/P60 family protein [Limosilactobacillus albertensis]
MSKVLVAALGAAGALAVANTASADTQVQVQSGDTVWGFAQQYATTIDSISSANQLADPNVIYVGQQLVIPSSAISTASAAATVATPTASDNANASQAAVQQTTASTTPVVSTTNASNVADQAQPMTVVSAASDNNATAQVNVASQAPAQVSAASATINVAQTSANVANNNVTTLATNATATPTQTTYAATEAVVTPQSNTTVQSTAAVSATPATQAAAGQGNGSTASAVATAQAQLGTPYVWGGNQPGGFDCSGLVQYSYGLGSNYRTTYQQTNLGAHHSDIQNAQSGDLYFWGPDSAPYHVAIATGNGGYIQAPAPGQNVQTGNINYYTPSFYISMN